MRHENTCFISVVPWQVKGDFGMQVDAVFFLRTECLCVMYGLGGGFRGCVSLLRNYKAP